MQHMKDPHPLIADYDADNYDYSTHWKNRAYELWAESYALRSLLARVGQTRWLIDFGGGFGRNFIHYCQRTEHAVIVDYSLGNLKRAASMYAREIESGHLFLIRADLYRLPFIDQAFDTGLIVRVLHHLTEVADALGEMERVVGQKWLLDVPIKHHLFARIRALLHREISQLSTWEPKMLGSADTPFANYHLGSIRQLLSGYGWDSTVIASVNNFRRWDQMLPVWTVALLKPEIYGLEMMVQRVGKGWWGPSQYIWATRRESCTAQKSDSVEPNALCATPWAALATKMICPLCHQPLHWSDDAAFCESCSCVYPHTGPIWDFVPCASR